MQRHSRPLDLLLWDHSRGRDRRAAVLGLLAAYQNEDGGFTPGIEPDVFGAVSTPVGTWQATQALRQIGCFDRAVPVVGHTVEYLLDARGVDGGWAWTGGDPGIAGAGPDEAERFATTAGLLGFLLRAGVDVRRDVLDLADQCARADGRLGDAPGATPAVATLLDDMAAAGLASAKLPDLAPVGVSRWREPATPRNRVGRSRTARAIEAVAARVPGSAAVRSHRDPVGP